jgi:hypothetical protein
MCSLLPDPGPGLGQDNRVDRVIADPGRILRGRALWCGARGTLLCGQTDVRASERSPAPPVLAGTLLRWDQRLTHEA